MLRTKEQAINTAKSLTGVYGSMAVFPWGPDGYTFCPLELAERAKVECIETIHHITPKKRKTSRSARWADAANDAILALDGLDIGALEEAIGEMRSVQEEYEEWKDNLPENLQGSSLGEKLEEVCGIEIEDAAQAIIDAIDEARSKIEEAEGVDLPQGFGRD